jgi:protein phosphatase
MSRIVLTAASRVGCIRTNNEDMVLAYDKQVRSEAYCTEFESENTDRFVIAVADGMGGHNAGEVASETALSNLKFFLSDMPKGLSSNEFNELMVEWLRSINQTINARGKVNPSLAEMGTTLVAIVYYNGHVFSLNCGDSRLYRFRNGKLTQMTTDHSLNNMTGQKKHSNIITNCIGAGCKNSYMDLLEFTEDFKVGDVYLLCSDGLNDMVDDEDIERLLNDGSSANRLCEEAIANGGFDNVSACVITVG